MNADEILALTTLHPDHDWQRNGSVMLPLVGREVPLLVLYDLENMQVTDDMAAALAELVAIGPDRWDQLSALLLADAQRECSSGDLGFPPVDGEDTTQTNRREIGLNLDGSAPEGWCQQDWLVGVQVTDDGGTAEAALSFHVEWEIEHGAYARLRDGQFELFTP
ncbi:hypothetical protein [Antarctobacter jejuensis]|uniref:hypothetical protein n=1 Tax=Antarctobacter jejuensis TaxID=1439938 RepID=UPI003FD25FB8